MKILIRNASIICTFAVVVAGGFVVAQNQPQGQTPRPANQTPNQQDQATEDFAAPAAFPLAAPAGVDSRALTTAPANATNTGPIDPATWKFGTAFNPPPGAKIWNPVKLKMLQGGKVTGGTLFSATDPATYCAMAEAGYDFIWTEMQHDQRDWDQAAHDVAYVSARCRGAGRPCGPSGGARDSACHRRRCDGDRRADG